MAKKNKHTLKNWYTEAVFVQTRKLKNKNEGKTRMKN
jgi:hypothetical protein